MASLNSADQSGGGTCLTIPLELNPRKIFAALFSRARNDRNNLIWAFLVGAIASALGSALTVLVWIAFLYNAAFAITGRLVRRLDGLVLLAVMAPALYCIVKAALTFGHSGLASWLELVRYLIFLTPLVILKQLRNSNPTVFLDVFVLGCGFSTLLAAPLTAYQSIWLGARGESLCGNPGVFAVMALVFGSIGTLNVISSHNRRRVLGYVSWLTMLFCVGASGMRAMWAAVPFVTLVLIWGIRPIIPNVVFRRSILGLIAVLIIGGSVFGQTLWDRAALIQSDIARMETENAYDTSTGKRLLMYKGAWRAITEAPVLGYGLVERMEAVRENLTDDESALVSFSHPHNGFLAAMLDAGIFGLAALLFLWLSPVAIATSAPRDATWRPRLAIALMLVLPYGFSGLTNVMFEHDLMDAGFLATLMVIATSLPKKTSEQGAVGE